VNIQVSPESFLQYQGDAVVVGVTKGVPLAGVLAEVDHALAGLVGRLIQSGEIRGKPSEVTVLHVPGKLPSARIAVVGLGEPAGMDLFRVRRAMGVAARLLARPAQAGSQAKPPTTRAAS